MAHGAAGNGTVCDKPAAGAAVAAPKGSADAPTLRDATIADLPRLLQIEAQFPGDRLSPRQFRHHLRRGAPLRVIEDRAGVAGYSLLLRRRGSTRARLYSIAVAPACGGRGLGARLLADAERCAAACGATVMTLEVRVDNAAAIALYRRHGYRETGRRAGYYDDGATALCMQRSLVSGP